MKQRLAALFVGLVVAQAPMVSTASSHEMWIDATEYQITKSDKIIADMRVGQNFRGTAQRYIPDDFIRLDIALGDRLAPVPGRLGDTPAIAVAPLDDGLNILVHQSKTLTTSYATLEKFQAFVEHKALDGAIARHKERGLPETGFREAYARYAKALIGVGHSEGADKAFGLDTEFVALENPYTDDMSDGIDMRIELFGAPKAGAQVEVFEQPDNTEAGTDVVVTLLTADENGLVTVPVKPGHSYLLDSVYLREPSAETAEQFNAVWETLWAAITFHVPGN